MNIVREGAWHLWVVLAGFCVATSPPVAVAFLAHFAGIDLRSGTITANTLAGLILFLMLFGFVTWNLTMNRLIYGPRK